MSHSGILFNIQVARMCLMNFTGLLLLMQKWQTMTLCIDRLMIYTCSYFQSLVPRGFPQPGDKLVPAEWSPWLCSRGLDVGPRSAAGLSEPRA